MPLPDLTGGVGGPRGLADPASPEAQVAATQAQGQRFGLGNPEDTFGSLRQFQAQMMAQNKDQSPLAEILKTGATISYGPQGVSVKNAPPRYVEGLLDSQKKLQEIMGSFHQEAEKLKAREAQLATPGGAIGQGLSTLAGNLATQRDMPGWVRGLGQTAKELNPSADELRNQRLSILGQEAQMAERSSALGEASMRTNLERQRLDLEQAGEARRVKDDARKVAEDAARDLRDTRDKFLVAAEKGDAPPAEVLNKLFSEKTDPKTAASLSDAITKTNEAARARLKAELALKERHETAFEKSVTAKTSEKSEIENAIHEAAKALEPMNKESLNTLTQISGMFGGSRLRVFAEARKLNPNFNTAQLGRMMDMEKSFTVGKDGQGLQSFDTFLQHAGELKDTLDGLYQSSSPALNKPMNWIRKNAEGNPEYQKLLVAIEPVGKEFESFLLNQRALYVDDRKRIDVLMNGNSSPAQIMAALSQMGKTAKDRFTAMNQRYKRVMKADVDHPFSSEALGAAEKIGIKLPQGETASKSETSSGPSEGDIVRRGGKLFKIKDGKEVPYSP